MNDGRWYRAAIPVPRKEGTGVAAFYVVPCILSVRCWGEAVFSVRPVDCPEVRCQNVNLLIPALCGSIIRALVRGRWQIRDSRAVLRKQNVCRLPVFSDIVTGTSVFPAQGGKRSGSFPAIRLYKMTARFGMPFRSD